MKTHDFAQSLSQLAKVLLGAPNVEIEDLSIAGFRSMNGNGSGSGSVGLHTLAELSKISKQQWLALIEENKFPISVRPRDASRDVLDKLLRYLDEDAEARERLKSHINNNKRSSSSKASPELMKALDILLER